MHLTEATYQHLLQGTLPAPRARPLASHLSADCDACEDYLASRPRADRLDGRVDLALASLPVRGAGRTGQAGNDVEFARIRRSLSGPAPTHRVIHGVAFAAAAAVAFAGLAALVLPRTGDEAMAWDGVKGQVAQAIPLKLRFLVVTPGVGGPPALEKGVPGQEVPSGASLQFQVELGRPANVLLVRASGRGNPEVFLSTRLPAGRHVVSLGGEPAAYPLEALAGPQRFLALASEAPLGLAEASRAAALGAEARREAGPAISLDQVEVRVRPGKP